MEQHPVPQNVTTFQFRLIGDMTIKQFGYLAGGIIAAYICYKLPLPFFFTWPLAITSGLLGFGLAFVPVEERPMDIWIASFFRNTYSPTQWIWSHETTSDSVGQKPESHKLPDPVSQTTPTHHLTPVEQILTIFSQWLNPVISTSKPTPVHIKLPIKTSSPALSPMPQVPPITTTSDSFPLKHGETHHGGFNIVEWFTSFFHNQPKPTPSLSPGFSFANAFASKQSAPPAGSPTIPLTHPSPDIRITQPPIRPPGPAPASTIPQQSTRPPDRHEHVASLQGQLTDMMRERERLEKELVAMRQKMDQQSHSPPTPPMRQAATMPAVHQSSPTVRVISPGAAIGAGLPHLTTFPNVVTGIVKDQYGNLLAGMLITVRDHNDVPLRALKTNRLGQFAASTPLPNDTYIVEIEDPKGGFIFDKAQIQLGGSVAPPLEVTAKSQKQVERDRLAKEIFGNTQM